MKIIVTLALMTTSLLSFGQSKIDMVLYPCGTQQMDRCIRIATDTNFSHVNIKIVPKCPSKGFPFTPVKIDFFIAGVDQPFSSLYSSKIPSDSSIIMVTTKAQELALDQQCMMIGLNKFGQ